MLKNTIIELLVKGVVFSLTFLFFSCQSKLEKSLAMAGKNRQQLEIVINHFRNASDPLKLKAAEFLIENMSGQYSFDGRNVNFADSLYLKLNDVAINSRAKYYADSYKNTSSSDVNYSFDLKTISADYLINAINDACEIWKNATWHDDYDLSTFFEYVLPYRIYNEPLSDWRASVEKEYPLLGQEKVLSRRGIQLETEDAQCKGCQRISFNGASNGLAEMMLHEKSSICFSIDSERLTEKRLILKYSGTAQYLKAVMSVNGTHIDTIRLSPTRNVESFSEKWFNKPIPLVKGKNTICISGVSDTLYVDYIQLGAIEFFRHEDLRDFTANYYNIVNKENMHCISFDTVSMSINNLIYLKPYSLTDSTQRIRLDYSGYPLWRIGYYRNDSLDMCLQIEFGTQKTLSDGTEVTIGEYIKRPFDQWLFIPLGNNTYRIMNKHTGMFLDKKSDLLTGGQILIQNRYSENDSQKWILYKKDKKSYTDTFFPIKSAISEAMRVFDLTHQFDFFMYDGFYATKGSSLLKIKGGKCSDETSFSLYLCRCLGIPSAYDFTPHWGNRSNSHSWSVLIDVNGKGVPFYMGNIPGDTAHYFHSYIKPKVFRHRYSLNKQIVKDMAQEASVPRLFKNPHFIDVTDEYCKTTDVKRPLPKEYWSKNVAYICVFDNRKWIPVHYGNVHNGVVTFKGMGGNIVYMAGVYEHGSIIPFGNPFLIDKDGIVKDIIPNTTKTITMNLQRKYPFMGVQDYFNSRMNGGQFQGSNNSNFSDYVVFHTHKGITNGNWYSVPVTLEKKFRFLRYIGAKGSFCNINELEFFDSKGKKVEGTIIGTEGESWARKENVFDGNILTGFGGISPDGNWVGLKLDEPNQIKRIKYIGRNDGNCIEIGDEYELYYWNTNGDWELLNSQKATSNSLSFSNIPSEGLYILKDITKGVEERIFTYEGGKQIWW